LYTVGGGSGIHKTPLFWFFDGTDVDFRNRKNQRSMNRILTMIIEICGNGGRDCIFVI